MTREFRERLSRIEMPCKKKYFQAVGKTLVYDEETGEWRPLTVLTR